MRTVRFTVGFMLAPLAALCLLAAPLPPAAAQAGGGNVQAAAAAVAQGDALLTAPSDAGSIAAYQQALADDPQYALAQQRLGDLYYYTAPDKAVVVYRALVSAPPGRTWDATANIPGSLGRCAVLLVRAGQGPEALSMYGRAENLLNHKGGKAHALEVDLPDLGDGVTTPPPTLPTLEAMAHLAAAVSGPAYDQGELGWALGRDYYSPATFFYLGKSLYLLGGHAEAAKSDLKMAVRLGTDQGDAQAVQAANAYLKRLP